MSSFPALIPSLIFSGFMFPVSSMPDGFRQLTLINPLRHFLVVIRSSFLKGTGFADHLQQYVALYVMATIGLSVAVLRFRKMVGGS